MAKKKVTASDVTAQDAAEEVAFRENMERIFYSDARRITRKPGRKRRKKVTRADDLLTLTLSRYTTLRELAESHAPSTVVELFAGHGAEAYAMNTGNPGLVYIGIGTPKGYGASCLDYAATMLAAEGVKHTLLGIHDKHIHSTAGAGADMVLVSKNAGRDTARIEELLATAKGIAGKIVMDGYEDATVKAAVDAFCTENSVTPTVVNTADYDPGGACEEVSFAVIDLT